MTTRSRTFVGFGFGAIQAGLFLYEAHRSRNFGRLVAAEVMPNVVDAVRAAGGRYGLNVATRGGIERHEISGVAILNPNVPADRDELVAAVAEASEMATALPSVELYGSASDPASVAGIIAEGVGQGARRRILYAAENHNHAAEILSGALGPAAGSERLQCLNTVIGKMSGVVDDAEQIAEQRLAPVAPGVECCFLVEEFNRILVGKTRWPDFARGIDVFEEKADLLPFEEAKLYGHNATHALIGYLGRAKGYTTMAGAGEDAGLMAFARDAFIEESGAALCRRHAGADPLFTAAGYTAYADDLLERMVNPHLGDTIARVTRDPRRKLGWDDRLIGTIRVALAEDIEPLRYAKAAAAALEMLGAEGRAAKARLLGEIWPEAAPADEAGRVKAVI